MCTYTPVLFAVAAGDTDVRCCTGAGACFQSVLCISQQGVVESVRCLLQSIVYSVQTTVTRSSDFVNFSVDFNVHIYDHTVVSFICGHLAECSICNIDCFEVVDVFLCEDVVDFFWRQLFVSSVGNALDHVADFFSHCLWQIETEVVFQDVSYAAFTGLGVDTDNVCFVFSADVMRIDWQVRTSPLMFAFFVSVFHSLGDSVLVGAGECCEYQLSAVWCSHWNFHVSEFFVHFYNFLHVLEVQFRVNSVGEHVQRQCNDVAVTCSFAVTEECTFDSVAACQQAQFCVCNACASVIVRVQGNDNVFSVM